METTFKYMADGVLTVDIEGNIIHANPVARNIVLIKNEEEHYDSVISRIKANMSLNELQSKNITVQIY